ncbi:hypothetical protein [Cytobacillus sp. IB215665]|uniref:hypothetical protein n=1 Tax=Cytobacillus sp. IB215665 TaxID=3097357 RepID=UPI002A0C143A|nr:hypothetical protein [Cytobacillus sp. IB215665]MDX8365240.1 hypothetical protein [Cytobacillus sp. IB215665]
MDFNDNTINQYLKEMQQLIKSHDKLLEKMNCTINERNKNILPLQRTVGRLIQHGLSKEEIVEITDITSDQYDNQVALEKRLQLPYVYLTEEETAEYEQLIQDIHQAKAIDELIAPSKEEERIVFIQKVLQRYLSDYIGILESDEDKYGKFVDKAVSNSKAKEVSSSLVRIFGNEIKRKREAVLLNISK